MDEFYCYLFVLAALGLVERGGFSSCEVQAQQVQRMGSLVGLSGPMACRTLVPRPGVDPVFPVMEGRFLATGPPRKSPPCSFIRFYFIMFEVLLFGA